MHTDRIRFPWQTGASVAAVLLALFLSACTDPKPSGPAAKPKKEHLVEIATVAREDSEVSRVRTGTLRARREVKVYTQEEGRIEELPFYEGDAVREGDLLLRLDDKVLQSQIDKARAVLNQAQQDLRRVERLHEKQLIAEEDLLKGSTNLEVAKAEVALLETRLGYTRINAPINGVVSERRTDPGNVVSRHDHVLTVIDTDSLVTEVSVSDLVLPLIAVGDRVDVRVDALGERVFQGVVSRIHPTLDATTRRGIIEVAVQPVPAGARPGQLCRVQLRTHAASRLMIPFSSLRRDESGEFVYVVEEDNTVRRAPIRSGLHVGERVEVLEGLSSDQRVVTKGFLGLTGGKGVKPVESTP